MSESQQRKTAKLAFKAANHKHAEAFMLMNYKCEKCGTEEVLWNSRDGITPFCIPCDACCHIYEIPIMNHIDFHRDFYSPLYQVNKGQRYFADMTREKARHYAALRIDWVIAQGEMEANLRNFKIKELAENYFGDGHQPDILIAE